MRPIDIASRSNAEYIDELYNRYRRDPRSVDDYWRSYFAGFELGLARSDGAGAVEISQSVSDDTEPQTPLALGVYDLVHSYRELGHFNARIDPLGSERPPHPLLDLSNFDIEESHLDRIVGRGGFRGPTNGTLRDLLAQLQATYCGTMGVEYTGISDPVQRQWLQDRIEPILNRPQLSPDETRALMFQLVAAEEFELYLARAFLGQKRFGLEGGESFIPMVNAIVEEGAALGGEKFIMSMAHRGRLNVLAHVLNKPYETLLSEFMYTALPMENVPGDGDVKYHLGYANIRPVYRDGRQFTAKVSMLPNPSHLELINPIMQGITRCQQQYTGDTERRKVVPINVHGDAAFTGQGIVAETLSLSELAGFSTGGTLHIIINNQIGFTTPPRQGRFTPYPTDIAKAIQAPIFHVNGDDPEAALWAAKLAIGFRQQFRCDVMIDLWCYRRSGHNETDEPSFTQPVMYRKIANHKTTRQLYAQRLLDEGRITDAELEEMKRVVLERLDVARNLAKEVKPRVKVPSFGGVWKGYSRAGTDWSAKTAVPAETLKSVISVYDKLPPDFTVHPKLRKLVLDARKEMVASGKGIDYGAAEMLAFGSLLLEGYSVRLTGQDVERGTFSHRHAVLFDYITGEPHYPLATLNPERTTFTIVNSMLSEFAVLGFEWGYSSADPRNLVLWEAQFGDFVNGAQPMIDQILAAAESKWRYSSGLVLLLPHGYEGQGPEHSNAYLERFLSLCAEENMQVCVPSTAAQYFHVLRRQIHRKFRKPLVLMMPKAMLRNPVACSNLDELTTGSFRNVIDDPANLERERVRRVLVCSGKVFYTLDKAREQNKITDTAIVRVEQLYPFPQDELAGVLARYGRKQEVCWVQEEPKNRGGWSFMEPRLRAMLPDTFITYHGRDEAASPAAGSVKLHEAEELEFVASALELAKRQQPAAPPTVSATKPEAVSQPVAK